MLGRVTVNIVSGYRMIRAHRQGRWALAAVWIGLGLAAGPAAPIIAVLPVLIDWRMGQFIAS